MKHKFLFSVFVIFFILVFITLGSWQIIRLNWKNNLILEIEGSLKNLPVEFTQTTKKNYLKIKTSGTIDFDKKLSRQFSAQPIPLTLILKDNKVIYRKRGFYLGDEVELKKQLDEALND